MIKKSIQLILALFVIAGTATAQSLVSATPTTLTQGKVVNISITGLGTHFNQGSNTVMIVDGALNEAAYIVTTQPISANVLAVVVLVSPLTTPGMHDLVVSNPTDGTLLLSNAFNIIANPASITGIYPATANAGQTLDVSITGSSTTFAQGSTLVSFFKGASQTTDITVNSVTVNSATTLTANISVASGALSGSDYGFVVNTTADGYLFLDSVFTVVGSSGGIINTVSPSSGNRGQTLNVTITGTNCNFDQGSNTVYLFSQGSSTTQLTVNNVTAQSANTIVANISIPTNADPGLYDLMVDNSQNGFVTKDGAFTVISNVSLASISPNQGKQGVTLNVTITGINTSFMQGSNTISFFSSGSPTADITVTQASTVSDGALTATLQIGANATPGVYDLVVNSVYDGILSINNAFTVLDSISTGLNKSGSKQFSIYPNPAHDFVQIVSKGGSAEELSVSLMDIGGRVLVKEQLITENGQANFRFGETRLSNGLYFMKIESKEGVTISRILIQ